MFEEKHSLCSKKHTPCVRRITFLVFGERHSLCSTKNIPHVRRTDIPCVRRKTFLVFEDDETPIFGRTDLRKDVSETKFDAEADCDVKKCLAPSKSAENHEKPKKNCEIFSEKKFWASKNCKLQIVRNAFSRSFAAIGAKFEGERKFFCGDTRYWFSDWGGGSS